MAAEYNLNKDLRRYRITSQSAIKNKTLAELDMRSKFGLTIVEIRNEKADKSGILKNIRQSLAGPDSILSADDIVYITGDTNMMDKFAEENRNLNLKCPILILLGDKDKTGKVRQYCKAWAEKTGYPLHIIKNASHFSNGDNPQQVNSEIEQFIKQTIAD